MKKPYVEIKLKAIMLNNEQYILGKDIAIRLLTHKKKGLVIAKSIIDYDDAVDGFVDVRRLVISPLNESDFANYYLSTKKNRLMLKAQLKKK